MSDMSEKHVAPTDPALYDPATSIDALDPMEPFDKSDFADYIYARFQASEKIYEPLKDLLASYKIEPDQILGSELTTTENSDQLLQFERAKLLVLARSMSAKNKKWRSIVSRSKPTMSAVFGSSAPGSLTHKEKLALSRHYITLLKNGIPAAQLDSAKPLLENITGDVFDGGTFEKLGSLMSTYTTNYITARQRELLAKSNKINGRMDGTNGYKHWPSDIPPDFGLADAIERAKDGFLLMLEQSQPDAEKDMARIRLLKDFFLDSESSFWEETHKLNLDTLNHLPPELLRLNLQMSWDQIGERVTQAFDKNSNHLPDDLLAEAECLIWLYGLKHCPITIEKADEERDIYFEGNRTPQYLAISAVILNHLRLAHKNIKIIIPGETYVKVPVYKAFQSALMDAGVDLTLGVEANKVQLTSAYRDMDTKAMAYLASLFSIATNAVDGKSNYIRPDYFLGQAEVKARRTALLAELPKMLKPYSCKTAFMHICTFICIMRDCTLIALR
jgi:hypothetical protein